ncbi:MAG: FAD:protein FMN transferase [Candidatus Krumholzibacteriota bacterium]|nr:FAD:protein FMN transferase [Candidatus Krumholzibacteriota bacterium]
MKRIQRAAVIIYASASLLFLSSCSDQSPYSKETFVMGTKAVITIYGLGEKEASEAAGEALHELHRIESVMSNWISESEISMLNGRSKDGPVRVSDELFEIIEAAFEYSRLTSGAFDITARPLVKLWGFQGGEPRLPSSEEIDSTLAIVGYHRVILDRDEMTVTLPPGMQIDLAGIGKGYGVDRCASILKEHGVTSALVNLSGNMFAIGSPKGRDYWSIGIREPHGEEGIVGKLLLRDEGVATSGNYENFIMIDGQKYGHIIDPSTGRTIDHILAVTVVAPSALAADALSTGMFVLGPEAGAAAAAKIPGVKVVYALVDDTFEFTGNFGKSLLLD